MALQLALPIAGTTSSCQRLWLIACSQRHLGGLRRVLASGMFDALIDGSSGTSQIGAGDTVLLRHGRDDFEVFGAATPLLHLAHCSSTDVTDEILGACLPGPRVALDMLTLWPSRTSRDFAERWPASALEDLLHQLRRTDLAASSRLRLCMRVLRGTGVDHGWLRAAFAGYAIWLARTGPDIDAESMAIERLILDLTSVQRRTPVLNRFASSPRECRDAQGDLFGHGSIVSDTRSMNLTAYHVWGISVPLRASASAGWPLIMSPFPRIRIDERRLSEAVGPVRSRRVVASASQSLEPANQDANVSVCVDWEARQQLGLLYPLSEEPMRVHVWIETRTGKRLAPPQRGHLGEKLSFMCSRREARRPLVVAFRSTNGLETRQCVRLADTARGDRQA